MTPIWKRTRNRIIRTVLRTSAPHLSDMDRIQKKVLRYGGIVSFTEIPDEHGPRFMATDLRTGNQRFATRVRYAKNYAMGFAERGALLAASYGLQCGDIPKGSVVLDCGAHYGDLELWLRATCSDPTASYFGFEPDAEAHACLARNVASARSRALPYALSDKRSMRTFYIEPRGANSSLEQPALPAVETRTESRTLDDVMEELGLVSEIVGLLKLEAEGHEPEVLLGAERTLPHVRLIAADLGPERGPNAEVTAPFVINHLLAAGFRVKRAGDDRLSLRFLFENTAFVAQS